MKMLLCMKLNPLAVSLLKKKNYWKTTAGSGVRVEETAILPHDWLPATFNHSQLSFVDIQDNKKMEQIATLITVIGVTILQLCLHI